MIFLQSGNLILPCVMTQLSHSIQGPAKPTSHDKSYGNMAFSKHKTKRKSEHRNCIKFKLGWNPNNMSVVYMSFHIFYFYFLERERACVGGGAEGEIVSRRLRTVLSPRRGGLISPP